MKCRCGLQYMHFWSVIYSIQIMERGPSALPVLFPKPQLRATQGRGADWFCLLVDRVKKGTPIPRVLRRVLDMFPGLRCSATDLHSDPTGFGSTGVDFLQSRRSDEIRAVGRRSSLAPRKRRRTGAGPCCSWKSFATIWSGFGVREVEDAIVISFRFGAQVNDADDFNQ